MNECLNCKSKNRDADIYCRNCGYLIKSNKHYIFINIMIVFLIIAMLFIIALFLASYLLLRNN